MVTNATRFILKRKIKAPGNLNTTKVFPIPDAPPVDFPSVSASVEAAEKQAVATSTGAGATPTGSESLTPPGPSRDPVNRIVPDSAGFAISPNVAGLYSAGLTVMVIAAVTVLV